MIELAAFILGFCTASAILGYPILRDYIEDWWVQRRIDRLSQMEERRRPKLRIVR